MGLSRCAVSVWRGPRVDDRAGVGTSTPLLQQQTEWLREHAGAAFAELQRADAKATAVCGIAGGLLTVCIGMLSRLGGLPWPLMSMLVLACLLLAGGVSAALWVLRPVAPQMGLRRELVGGTDAPDVEAFTIAASRRNAEAEQRAQARRLWMLAHLAGRKLRMIRLAVDLVVMATVLAGTGLLITCLAL